VILRWAVGRGLVDASVSGNWRKLSWVKRWVDGRVGHLCCGIHSLKGSIYMYVVYIWTYEGCAICTIRSCICAETSRNPSEA